MTKPPRAKVRRAGSKAPERIAVVFGRNLKAARLAQSMTQAQLAFDAGISQNRIPGIEAGLYDVKISTADSLSRAVGIPLRNLLPD